MLSIQSVDVEIVHILIIICYGEVVTNVEVDLYHFDTLNGYRLRLDYDG
jgi:hypothetical protein